MFLYIFVYIVIASCIKVLFRAKNQNETDPSVFRFVNSLYGIFDENNSFVDISSDYTLDSNVMILDSLNPKANHYVLLEYMFFDMTKIESNLMTFLFYYKDNFKDYIYLGEIISMDNFIFLLYLLNLSFVYSFEYDSNTFFEILNAIEYLDLFGNSRKIIINNLIKYFLLADKSMEILFTENYISPQFIPNISNIYNEILLEGINLFNGKCIFRNSSLFILHEKENIDDKSLLQTEGVHIFPCMLKLNVLNKFRMYFFSLIGFYMKMSDYAVLNLSEIDFLTENDTKIISCFSNVTEITLSSCFIKNSFIKIIPHSILCLSLDILKFSNILFDSKTFSEILNFRLKKISLDTCKITDGNFFTDLNLKESSKSLNSLILTRILLKQHDVEQISGLGNLSELSINNSSICSTLFEYLCKNETSKLKTLRFFSNIYSFLDIKFVFNLTKLEEIDFSRNKFFYSPFKCNLSSEFKNLEQLKILRLCDVYEFNRKNICGIICLKNLKELIISKNNFIDKYFLNFQGTLKLEVFKCQNVRLLSMDLDFFSCHLDLHFLNLKDNDINSSNLHYIFKFKNLYKLNLSMNKCISEDNLADFDLRRIQELKLNHCLINGSLSVCKINIDVLENLSFLSLSGNTLNISDILYIFNLKNLISLNISQCNIKKGYIPSTENSQIQNLDLTGNILNENDLLALFKIKKLKTLNISRCSLTKNTLKLLNKISKDSNIEVLDILHNRLSKRDINFISNLKKLNKLNVSSCFLEKSSLSNLKNLSKYKNLETLDISSNNISTEDISSILRILSLKELFMNRCSGHILKINTPSLYNLSRIKKLDLQENDLSFADLDFIVKLEYLEVLNLRNCKIGLNGLVIFSNAKSHLSLLELNLGYNILSASDILAINCFSTMRFLDLRNTKLEEGKFSFLRCEQLKKCLSVLILAQNNLDYEDVYNLSTFENLRKLDLSYSIRKPGLIYLFKNSCISKSLEFLDLSFCKLNANDILGILKCRNLLFLILKCCNLKYGCFSCYDELFLDLKIQLLSLKRNNISSKDLKNIFKIPTIRFLCLSHCNLPKNALDIAEFSTKYLNILHLNGNTISKKGFDFICNSLKLKELSVSMCRFRFRFLKSLLDKPIMETLEVFKANRNLCHSEDLINFYSSANEIEYYFMKCRDESGQIVEF
ncbi:hypothetical protein LUQ84_003219 [Hamiltosporidium tvaerminnensis]|nr:hypothetical protein LUQ84_003219 [Hamiltosporidium tvaerminnensis]